MENNSIITMNDLVTREEAFVLGLQQNNRSELRLILGDNNDLIGNLTAAGRARGSSSVPISIFSDSLDKVSDRCSSFGHLVAEIKSEYDRFITALEQGQYHEHYVKSKLKSLTTNPVTLVRLRIRVDELQNKIEVLKRENREHKHDLIELMGHKERGIHRPKCSPAGGQSVSSVDNYEQQLCSASAISKSMPHSARYTGNMAVLTKLSLKDTTDVVQLTRYANKLQYDIQRLEHDITEKYSSKEKRDQLQTRLLKKENTWQHLNLHHSCLKERYEKLKIAVDVSIC